MKLKDKILQQLDDLIKMACDIAPSISTITKRKNFGCMTDEEFYHEKFVMWNTLCLYLLSRIQEGKSAN